MPARPPAGGTLCDTVACSLLFDKLSSPGCQTPSLLEPPTGSRLLGLPPHPAPCQPEKAPLGPLLSCSPAALTPVRGRPPSRLEMTSAVRRRPHSHLSPSPPSPTPASCVQLLSVFRCLSDRCLPVSKSKTDLLTVPSNKTCPSYSLSQVRKGSNTLEHSAAVPGRSWHTSLHAVGTRYAVTVNAKQRGETKGCFSGKAAGRQWDSENRGWRGSLDAGPQGHTPKGRATGQSWQREGTRGSPAEDLAPGWKRPSLPRTANLAGSQAQRTE